MHAETPDTGATAGRVRELHPISSLERRWLMQSTLASIAGRQQEPVTVGRYVLRELVGRGAQGVVWKAEDHRLRRTVAIKQLDLDLAKHESLLRREARAMARVAHPNVAAVFDAVFDEGNVFVVMEFVPGTTLGRWLTNAPSPDTILRAFLGAGRGLAAVHSAGLAHGDFKPSNVLVRGDDVAKVLDFGLTRYEQERTGIRGGSLPYMAPEMRSNGVPTQRADQYAFARALDDALAACRAGEVNAPAEQAVSPRIRQALHQALADDPAQRWTSMDEFLRALEPQSGRVPWLVLGSVVTVGALGLGLSLGPDKADRCLSGDTRLAETWNPTRRTELAEAFSATTQLLPNEAVGAATYYRVEALLDDYAQRWKDAYPNTCKAKDRNVRHCLDRQLARLDVLLATWSSSIDRAALDGAVRAVVRLDEPNRCIGGGSLRPGDTDEVGPLLDRGYALRDAGRRAEATATADRAVEHAMRDDEARQAEALLLSGELLRHTDPPASVDRLEAALHRALASGQDRLEAEIGVQLAHTAALVRQPQRAQRAIRAAESAVQRYGGDRRVDVGLDGVRALLALNRGAHREAIVILESSLDDTDGLSPNLKARVLHNLARLRLIEEEPSAARLAVSELRDVLSIETRLYGDNHPNTAATRTTLGQALLVSGDTDAAYRELSIALEDVEQSWSPDDGGIATALTTLAIIDAERTDYDKAAKRLERALEVRIGELGEGHPDAAVVYGSLAAVAEAQGDLERALELRKEVLSIFTLSLGEGHPWSLRAADELGATWERRGLELEARGHEADAQAAFGLSRLYRPSEI